VTSSESTARWFGPWERVPGDDDKKFRVQMAYEEGKPWPEDLVHHDTIAIPRGERMPQWHFASGRRNRAVVVHPRVLVSSFELGIAAAVAGLGVVPCTEVAARPYLTKKQLVPVLQSWTPPALTSSRRPEPGTRLPFDQPERLGEVVVSFLRELA